MARIPDEEIARIKKETDLVALVRSRGVELGKHGMKDWVGRCPFHTEEKSSFIVSPDKGLYHCMGCGAAGNAIQFVEKFDGVSFRHAFELLSEGRPAFSAQATEPLKQATVPRLENPFEDTPEDAALLARVVEFYHERLLKTSDALDYLKVRGLNHEEAIERFGLGFADRTLGLRLPAKNRLAGEAIRTRLQALGLIRESGHEHFSGSVVLPIYTAAGTVGEIYGRKITSNLRKGTPLHLYLQGPHEGIWNAEALEEPEVILCEAPFDALTFWVNGFRNVTFIYGTEGFTDELFEALLVRKVRRVRIAYDADEAGNRAAKRDAERLMAHGIEVYRVKFPWGMDANDYARKVTPAPKSLQLVLKAAEWVGGTTNTRPEPPPDPEPPTTETFAAAEARSLSESSHTLSPAHLSLAALLAAEGSKPLGPEEPCLERVGEYHLLRLGQREYRVGGLDKNNSLEVLKIALRLRHGEDFHLDSFDMARDGDRRRFIERAAEETRLEKDLIKRDLGRLLLLLEEVQTARINAALEPAAGPRTPEMSVEERDEALSFLKSPNLVERIAETFEACGLVGENANRLAAYLACTSRKLEKPLAVIIQSTSAAGKSTLMEAVLAMFPEEERVKYSAMTGQSLYYLGETNLKHKILAIVEEEGAEKASYALKLLQSEGELTIASTGKDPQTGRMETQEYHVEGPVMIFLTTTAIDIDEELQNRCLTLSVDESRKQTERIHALQRKARTLEGLRLKKERRRLLTVMRNVQRLLKPVDVVNPWADELTFTTERTRTRRDHEKYLTLIDAIALLHQYQRPREVDQESAGRSEFIRVTLEDIALANRLAPELLGRSLDDLPPQTRGVYEAIKQIVRERCKSAAVEQRHAFFSRRDVRSRLGWSVTQVRIHLDRLRDLEYIAARFGRPGSAFQYELLTDCNEPRDVGHIGLLDVEKLRLRQQPDGKKEHLTGGWRTPPRQVRNVQEPALAFNLTA
ncbi:MAG: CHC2 zinc finger domain-containing protein [Candidatus Methylomirabilia bacterium]